MERDIDKAAPKGAGAPKSSENVVVTPAMIQAGECCLNELLEAALTSPEAAVLHMLSPKATRVHIREDWKNATGNGLVVLSWK